MSSRDHATAALLARLAMSFDGALLGVSLAYFAARAWFKYNFSSRSLDMIRSAPSPPISDLRSLLQPESGESLVVVRGHVNESPRSSTEASLISQGTGERAVVIQRVQTCLYSEWRGVFGWNFDLHTLFSRIRKEQYLHSSRSVPFILTEGPSLPSQDFVHVKLVGSSQPLPLITVAHQLLPIPSFSSSLFQAVFGGGSPVAILDEEKIIPVGKVITAVGFCRLKNGALEIKSSENLPYFLSDMTKDEMESNLALNIGILFWGSVLLGTLSVGILGYSFISNWRKWQEWRHRRHYAEEPNEPNFDEGGSDGDGEELGNVPDGQLCVICLARRRKSAFLPCGHLVCCPRCAIMVERELSPKCPLCRQNIRSSVRIYAS